MKTHSFLTIIFLIFSCLNAQCNDIDNENAKQIIDFYVNIANAWERTILSVNEHSYEEYVHELDSLAQHYCTERVRRKQLEWSQDGHEYLTYDGMIDVESLKSLSVEKYSKKPNTYLVAYFYTTVHVKLLVTLIEENGRYLIDEITGVDEE